MTDEKKYPDYWGRRDLREALSRAPIAWPSDVGKTSSAVRLIARIAEVYRGVKIWAVGPRC